MARSIREHRPDHGTHERREALARTVVLKLLLEIILGYLTFTGSLLRRYPHKQNPPSSPPSATP